MSRLPGIRRMHFNEDGSPKKALSPEAAAKARERGKRTYLCPFCGKTHAGGES